MLAKQRPYKHQGNCPFERFSFEGSNGVPLNGEPYAFQASFKAYSCFYYSDVGRPICFRCCSYMILRMAPWVSSSNYWRGFVLVTLEVSISGSPLKTVFQIFSSAFYRFSTINDLPPDFSIFQTDSPAFIFS